MARRLIQNALLLCLITALSGCASFSLPFFGKKSAARPVEIQTKAVEKQNLNLKTPDPLNLKDVEWIIVNKSNVEEVWKKLKKNEKDIVLFGITDDSYKELSVNLIKLRNLINTQRIVIMQYKKYYEQ
tara:strand:+ start:251 stop:634 length:384 start_codon:yes stop_codon:yes gene_type:complete